MKMRDLGLSAALLALSAMPAHAYLDPGTGSIIAQAVIGAIVAGGFFARQWLGRVRAFLGLAKPAERGNSDDQR